MNEPQNSTDNDRSTLIAWSQLPFLRPRKIRRLLEEFTPLSAIHSAGEEHIATLLSLSLDEARQIIGAGLVPSINGEPPADMVTILDPDYPPLLRETADPPPLLRFRGDVSRLTTRCVAVVGSRNASRYGLEVTEMLTRALARAGLTVVSGFARGIDAQSHRTATREGATTVAVLGTGLNVPYPSGQRDLFDSIIAKGAIISEFAPDTPPRPENFPIRNRIIAGMSVATVVVEASNRSGSLITARLANEAGRDVYAVPGPVFSQRSEGTHRLIQDGAKLIHDVDDLLEELVGTRTTAAVPEDDGPDSPLLQAIGRGEGLHIDAICATTGMTLGEASERLLELELEGKIRSLPGSRYARAG